MRTFERMNTFFGEVCPICQTSKEGEVVLVGKQEIEMPKNPEILCVQMQNDEICLWAAVDQDSPITKKVFMLYGTGQNLDQTRPTQKYIGTVQTYSGFVWHIMEVI